MYTMGDTLIDYVPSEKDLGITVNRTLNFTKHANSLYSKANQRFGFLKRICHFKDNTAKRRVLYLTMVRSIFEHCPVVWRPSSNTTMGLNSESRCRFGAGLAPVWRRFGAKNAHWRRFGAGNAIKWLNQD